MATKLTPSRNSTYERPFTHEGNYIVFYLKIQEAHVIVLTPILFIGNIQQCLPLHEHITL